MTVEKVCWLVGGPNEPDCYLSVPYLRVSGSEEEIGRYLAEFARQEYQVNQLGKYVHRRYARARLDYFRRNWPQMADRMRGVADAFGVNLDRNNADPSALIYDLAPRARGPVGMGCSAAFLPAALAAKGGPVVARNFDAWRVLPSQSRLFSRVGRFERCCYSRSFVLEVRPSDGMGLIALGGHDLLFPFQAPRDITERATLDIERAAGKSQYIRLPRIDIAPLRRRIHGLSDKLNHCGSSSAEARRTMHSGIALE
jgi:hypothetical protein